MWDKVSDEDLADEIERRARDNRDKALAVREGKLPGDTIIYIGFLPYLPCLIRTGAAQARILFGMKTEIAGYMLNDVNEITHTGLIRMEEGYVTHYERLDINLKHPRTGTPLREAMKGKSVDWTNPTGIIFANEIVDQVRKDKSFKLYGAGGYLKEIREGFSIPDEDLDAKCGLQYDILEIRRSGAIYPMPPTMRGFLLMGKADYVDWLKEIIGGEDLIHMIPTLQERFRKG